ncbi:cuticle protein CP1876-like [Homarus americanus]|uniref:cuticle protein CP1876-like n=1 Tax=Homarus americanus TaxID=6706 RepID=UPI001C479DDE|nr:cuticle protein CP1876-like [Homarus americanus]
MRTLVVLAVVGVCSAFPFIPDNPDVAAEKARFFQAFKAAEAAALPRFPSPHQSHDTGHYTPTRYGTSHYNPPQYTHTPAQPKWTGPVAATVPAGVDGTLTPVSDTRDVAAARNTFFNTYRSQVAATLGAAPRPHGGAVQYQAAPSYRPAPSYQPKWTGPLASTIPAGLPGSTNQVADTPEVAAAKHSFHNTYQRQAAAAAPPSRYY